MIYDVYTIVHMLQRKKLKFSKYKKRKNKNKNNQDHIQIKQLYPSLKVALSEFETKLIFFKKTRIFLYTISMQKIIKKLTNIILTIIDNCLRFTNAFLWYYVFMPVLPMFKIYIRSTIRKTLGTKILIHIESLNLLCNKVNNLNVKKRLIAFILKILCTIFTYLFHYFRLKFQTRDIQTYK